MVFPPFDRKSGLRSKKSFRGGATPGDFKDFSRKNGPAGRTFPRFTCQDRHHDWHSGLAASPTNLAFDPPEWTNPSSTRIVNSVAPFPASEPRPIRSLHILYAEDLKQLRDFMGIMLGREGHTVETADDGTAALERLGSDLSAFDLLITDHHMPRLNGLELVRCLRRLPFAGRIIVFSSELSEEINEQYRKLGVDLILPKPIFPVTFRTMLRELFQGELKNAAAE